MHQSRNLQDLLVDGTRYDPRYLPSGNADHMPMTLCAITGLGGDFDTMITYRNEYKKILHEAPTEYLSGDWRSCIGQNESYPSLLAWFSEQVADRGIESTVSDYLPEFVCSLALEAFHPIIRLGYAIDFESEAETAAALAYIVSSHQNVPIKVDKVIDLQTDMHRQVTVSSRSFKQSGFTKNVCELVDSGEYPVGCAEDISDCAIMALDTYRSTRNFFALHMVTATQAVRICSEFIDKRLALAALTGGLLAAHKVVGSPCINREKPMLMSNSLGLEHAYKYAWTCLSEYRHYGDVRYAEEIKGLRKIESIPQWCASEEV